VANVYSVKLFEGPVTTGGSVLYTVPGGFTAVLRTATWSNHTGAPYRGLSGFSIFMNSGTYIVDMRDPVPVSFTSYSWDGHLVMSVGDYLTAIALDDGWTVTLSGYQLSLP
jgi:hypothetical protein